eukprot:TRINITY_DN27674_c0_g1_i1.p1 TRINITY_DN27674_c0_g1~~TRINITY_DN27674_c0_g1_i1.p1  ORF type:complete len:432 (+),score=88.92 TRINITY_DN27674_c0_g1_i1:158-1453(+)
MPAAEELTLAEEALLEVSLNAWRRHARAASRRRLQRRAETAAAEAAEATAARLAAAATSRDGDELELHFELLELRSALAEERARHAACEKRCEERSREEQRLQALLDSEQENLFESSLRALTPRSAAQAERDGFSGGREEAYASSGEQAGFSPSSSLAARLATELADARRDCNVTKAELRSARSRCASEAEILRGEQEEVSQLRQLLRVSEASASSSAARLSALIAKEASPSSASARLSAPPLEMSAAAASPTADDGWVSPSTWISPSTCMSPKQQLGSPTSLSEWWPGPRFGCRSPDRDSQSRRSNSPTGSACGSQAGGRLVGEPRAVATAVVAALPPRRQGARDAGGGHARSPPPLAGSLVAAATRWLVGGPLGRAAGRRLCADDVLAVWLTCALLPCARRGGALLGPGCFRRRCLRRLLRRCAVVQKI